MVQRDYRAPQFQMQDTRQVRATQVSGTDTSVNAPRQIGDSSWRDRFVQDLSTKGQALLNKMADVEFSNLYLEGQAQAGIVESEAELEGNPLTRDWKVAGYRDTMGKLAIADAQAQFMTDLPKLREQTPEEFKAYLSQRREKLIPGWNSMSREARASSAGQLLLLDRDATSRWTSERTKYILEQKSAAIHTPWHVTLNNLRSAQLGYYGGNLQGKDYKAAVESATGTLMSAVWGDPSLPSALKRSHTFEMLQSALVADSVELYDYIDNTPLPDGKGGTSTLTSRLDPEQQQKLGTAYAASRQRTKDARTLVDAQEVALLEAEAQAGTYQGTYAEAAAKINPMILNNTLSGDRGAKILADIALSLKKQETNAGVAAAVTIGDFQYGLSRGLDMDKQIKVKEADMTAKGFTSAQKMSEWLKVGLSTPLGYKQVGSLLGPSIRQIVSSKGEILPQHLELFKLANSTVQAATASGEGNTRVAVLSGLAEDDRMFAERVFSWAGTGASIEEAVQRAKAAEEREQQMAPAVRAARAQQTATAVGKSVDAIEPVGLLGSLWLGFKGMFGVGVEERKLRPEDTVLSPGGRMFSSNDVANNFAEDVRAHVRQAASDVLLRSPEADPEAVMKTAMADVASRTINTKNGPLVLPKGINVQQVFGVGKGNEAAIGVALENMLKPTRSDGRWWYSFQQGRVFVQEFGNKGPNDRIGTGHYLDYSEIRKQIEEDTKRDRIEANVVYGAGKSAKSPEGNVEVQYNGVNNAGAPATWMLAFRDNLVGSEGIRSYVYDDATGKRLKPGEKPTGVATTGIGVSERSAFYPKADAEGNITREAIMQSFSDASGHAAKAGISLARRLGRETKETFLLLSEIAYQSGNAFHSRPGSVGDEYRAFLKELREGKAEDARNAFMKTAAWRRSADSRRQHYIDLINKVKE